MKYSLKYTKGMLMQALRQGIAPRQLAVTCALGIVIGIFPVLGTTTLLCFAAALMLRLNIPIIQLVNYLMAPLQIILMIPFIKAGEHVFSMNAVSYEYQELLVLFSTSFWLFLKEAGLSLLLGVGVWCLLAVPLFALLFYPLYWMFLRLIQRR